MNQQSSPEYQWTLRQLELAKERMRGLRRIRPRTSAIIVYLARSPKQGANLHEIYQREEQGNNRLLNTDQQNHHSGEIPPTTEDDVLEEAPPAPFNPHGSSKAGNDGLQWERNFLDRKTGGWKGQPPAKSKVQAEEARDPSGLMKIIQRLAQVSLARKSFQLQRRYQDSMPQHGPGGHTNVYMDFRQDIIHQGQHLCHRYYKTATETMKQIETTGRTGEVRNRTEVSPAISS